MKYVRLNFFFKYWIVSVLVLFSITCFGQKSNDFEKINGVGYVSPKIQSEFGQMKSITRINANWVGLTPFRFLKYNNPHFEFDTTKNWEGDTIEGIKMLIKEAKENSLKILLKPHFIMEDYNWVGDFSLESKDWLIWEENYSNYLMKLAELSEIHHVEMICIGTEFKHAVVTRPKFWNKLISDIRTVYTGKLTYAANWDNYNNILFWDQLDYIGVDAYFPLSDENKPSTRDLDKKWKEIVPILKKFSAEKDKEILFTEYGYRSVKVACGQQWTLESIPYDKQINMASQVNGYQALFDAIWNESWFAGGFIWRWSPDDKKAGGLSNSNYTPQNKPVEKVIRKYYSK